MLRTVRANTIYSIIWVCFLFSCAILTTKAQIPHYDFAKALGTTIAPGYNRSEASRTVVDADGNMYVVGQFAGSVQFGQFTLTSVSVPHDVFVAKLDSLGNYLWVAQGGGLAEDYGNAIGLDAAGNVYVAGSVATGNANTKFGSIALPGGLPGSVSDDIVVAKLSPNGTWLWAVSGGGDREDKVSALAVDARGNICVTGSSLSPIITFGATTLTNPFFHYVACTTKLDTNGNWLWAVMGGGTSGGSTESNDIALDDVGNAYITGSFEGPAVNFGSIQVRSGTLYPAVFVAKLTPDGQYQWVVPGGGGLYDFGQGIAVDSQRNIYITGSFNSPTAPFGPFVLTNVNSGLDRPYTDLFVAKLTPNGQYQWVVRGGGLYDDQARSIRVDGQGNLLLTGYYNSPTISLGSVALANRNIGSPGSFGFYDSYVAHLNSAGQFLWGVRGGGAATDFSFDVAVGGPGKAPYITGYFTNAPAEFGPFTLPANPSGYTGFIARLSAPAPSVQVQGDSLLCQGGQVTLRAVASTAVRAYHWSTGASTSSINVGQPGTYTVTVTFSSGQTATTAFHVITLSASLAISGDTLLCPGSSGQLRAIGAPAGATYLWSTGAQTANITVSQAGRYTLTATYGTGCTLSASIQVRIPSLQITGRSQICSDQGSTAQLTASAPGATAYRWNTGATTALLTVAQAGAYTVTATFSNGCILTATQAVSAPLASIQGDSIICPGRTSQLSAANSAATAYAWSTGATTSSITVSLPGKYSVAVSFGTGCSTTARYQVRAEASNLPFTLGADTTLCEGDQFVLRARPAVGAGVQYLWSDGSTGSQLLVQQPGLYRLQRATQCETQMAVLQVTSRNCMFIPNIITPNGDGANDLFVIKGLPPGAWALEVYNRWGRLEYQTDSYHADWGSLAAPGLYYYVLRQTATTRSYKGWVEVVR